MNIAQRLLLILGLAAIALMALFPPWRSRVVLIEGPIFDTIFENRAGYSFLLNPPATSPRPINGTPAEPPGENGEKKAEETTERGVDTSRSTVRVALDSTRGSLPANFVAMQHAGPPTVAQYTVSRHIDLPLLVTQWVAAAALTALCVALAGFFQQAQRVATQPATPTAAPSAEKQPIAAAAASPNQTARDAEQAVDKSEDAPQTQN